MGVLEAEVDGRPIGEALGVDLVFGGIERDRGAGNGHGDLDLALNAVGGEHVCEIGAGLVDIGGGEGALGSGDVCRGHDHSVHHRSFALHHRGVEFENEVGAGLKHVRIGRIVDGRNGESRGVGLGGRRAECEMIGSALPFGRGRSFGGLVAAAGE